ncbi:MAG: VWA domain-containing protein [Candidatus Uhrbacteria bacterium]
MKIEAKLDRTKLFHKDPGALHMMVSVTAPEVIESERMPIDACIVIDISGSMSSSATKSADGPTKMALTKQAAQRLVENLTSTDRVGLVVFSTEVTVLAQVAVLTDAHRQRLAQQLKQLRPTDTTNLIGGALRGIDCLQEVGASANRTQRILLFTDGIANVGIRDHAGIITALSAKRKSFDGRVSISTFGFGAHRDYEPELLTSIATLADGNYYHCEGADGILEAFADELGALRSVAATDVRIMCTPGKDVRVIEVLNDLTVRTDDDTTTIDVGSLYSEETQHVVVALAVPKHDKAFPRPTRVLDVLVKCVTATGEIVEQPAKLEIRYVKRAEADEHPDPMVEEQRVQQLAARKIDEAHHMAERGDHIGAQKHIVDFHACVIAVGTDAALALAAILRRIADDVGDVSRFHAQAMNVRSASTSVGKRRTTGSSYTKAAYASVSQVLSREDMGAKPVVDTPPPPKSPLPQAGSANIRTPMPRFPDKRSSRKW